MFDSFMSLYQCEELIQQIESRAEQNDGLLTDEDMQAIVLAQTTSLEKLRSLAGYVKYLEGFQKIAKAERDRLYAQEKTAENRVESIKNWLLPWLQEHGPQKVGLHSLTLRPSEAVILDDDFKNAEYGETVMTYKADKKKIKESIQRGIEVKGAKLEKRVHVQIK